MTEPDLFDQQRDRPVKDLFAPDDTGRCLQCRAGSHRACRGPRQCRCTDDRHTDRGADQ